MTTVSPDNSDNTDPTDQPPGDLSGDVRRPARLRCARALFVLSADDGRLWIAFDPNPGAPHDGVMPHLQENDDVTVTGTTDDGGLSVLLKGDGHSVLDAVFTAYPVPAALLPDAFKPPSPGVATSA